MLKYKKGFTTSFNNQIKGWTTFHSFSPDFMIGMNNKFFSFKNGNLYEHHSDESKRNEYYGKVYPSKVTLIFNDNPSDVKEVKAISLEGNTTWETLIKAYKTGVEDFNKTSVKEVEFVKKEGIWYSYARRNEDDYQTDSKSMYGIGIVESVSNNVMIVNGFNDSVVEGDEIVRGLDLKKVGAIVSSERMGDKTKITLNSSTTLTEGEFICGLKNVRIEGGNLRGYALRVELTTEKEEKVELFSVNIEVIKSYQ